jgi:hypothetical protein
MPPNSAYNKRYCVYRIADGCSATGHCADVVEPVSGVYVPLCGCHGEAHAGGGYASGYASGPTTGATFCDDAGI